MKLTVVVCIFFASLVLFFTYRYRRRPTKLIWDTDKQLSEKDLEYYRGLPRRLSANYYPRKETYRDVLLLPILSSGDPEKIDVTFLVKSAARNFQRRKVVRGTWGSVKTFKNANLRIIFIVGTDPNHEERLNSESTKFQDILQVNITDKITNQARKMLSALHWIIESRTTNSEFYFATEDTCVINIDIALEFLLNHKAEVEASIHCGYMFENNTGVIRGHGARSVSKILYPKRTYPAFCRGQLVIFSYSYMKKIYEVSMVTNITGFHLDDVLLYGILREKLGDKNNIKNIINGGVPLVYYPWDETEKAIFKMLSKWQQWKFVEDNSKATTVIPPK